MKKALFAFIGLLFVSVMTIGFTSCKSNDAEIDNIVGTWKLTNDYDETEVYIFKKDGTGSYHIEYRSQKYQEWFFGYSYDKSTKILSIFTNIDGEYDSDTVTLRWEDANTIYVVTDDDDEILGPFKRQ